MYCSLSRRSGTRQLRAATAAHHKEIVQSSCSMQQQTMDRAGNSVREWSVHDACCHAMMTCGGTQKLKMHRDYVEIEETIPCNACPLCFMPCTYGASLLLYVSYLAVIRTRHAVESEIRPAWTRPGFPSRLCPRRISQLCSERGAAPPPERCGPATCVHSEIFAAAPDLLCRRPAWDLVASPALRFPTSTTRSKASTLTPQTVRMTALTAPLLLAGPGRTRTLAMATWHGAWNMLPPSIRSSLWPLPAVSRILICLLARSRRLLASSRCSRAGCACVMSPATKGASI